MKKYGATFVANGLFPIPVLAHIFQLVFARNFKIRTSALFFSLPQRQLSPISYYIFVLYSNRLKVWLDSVSLRG